MAICVEWGVRVDAFFFCENVCETDSNSGLTDKAKSFARRASVNSSPWRTCKHSPRKVLLIRTAGHGGRHYWRQRCGACVRIRYCVLCLALESGSFERACFIRLRVEISSRAYLLTSTSLARKLFDLFSAVRGV